MMKHNSKKEQLHSASCHAYYMNQLFLVTLTVSDYLKRHNTCSVKSRDTSLPWEYMDQVLCTISLEF